MERATHRCPCCGCLTLEQAPPGTQDICPVCYWEDDPLQSADPLATDGPNRVSLRAARRNYQDFRASHAAYRARVRAPLCHEAPRARFVDGETEFVS